jgi:hypothetical protein
MRREVLWNSGLFSMENCSPPGPTRRIPLPGISSKKFEGRQGLYFPVTETCRRMEITELFGPAPVHRMGPVGTNRLDLTFTPPGSLSSTPEHATSPLLSQVLHKTRTELLSANGV